MCWLRDPKETALLGATSSIKIITNLQIQMSMVVLYNYLYVFLISSVIGSVVNIVVQMIG